ncbi:acylphosphatase [Bacillus sp. V5-8f]|uniref:acylphosphatase n=1 Tax=Bacillus sp. V5-8f TaxID=2053044 RepID=UPI0015E0618B|nr:acylphosphatase [Bacillus sp. V5-8f]
MKHIHIVVSGHVQGVGFRYFTQVKALEHHITGWVKNREDGTVEIVAAGNEKQLSMFISWLKKGNRFSTVENVSVTPLFEEKTYSNFSIKK